MGTPGFAAESLARLYADGRDVVAVFTQPDKPQSRGMKMTASPVKELALSRGTPVLQPEKLRGADVLDQLNALKPDLIAVVAYGKLLPPAILELPAHGCINIHGSLLPKYRGAAPVQRAVLNGEKETGVTSMYMAPEMDAGDIILVRKTAIGENETSGELYGRMAKLGAELLSETIDAIQSGTAPRVKQNGPEATYAPPLTKDLSPIDWSKSAREIVNLVRGLNPWPVATADITGTAFKIYNAAASGRRTDAVPGTLLAADKNGIEVACAGGSVLIRELQAPGGRRMAAADYLRGHPICL